MSLTEHLAELRTCLIVSVIAIGIGFIVAFYFSEDLLKILTDLIITEQRHVLYSYLLPRHFGVISRLPSLPAFLLLCL